MKIIAIEIKNLASLEGVHSIDFRQEPLKSAGIFAITGPTGAGKSTVLDGLCLALYGRTPRYAQAKGKGIKVEDIQGSIIQQNDPRGILRDGTGEGSASVIFIGIDQQQYKATWAVRRARARADGQLQDAVCLLENLSTHTIIPGKNKEIQKETERLVGLSFEQFTRSVLLAQGDFTAFLKADKDEKSALLEKLTGTQIYSEISQTVYAHFKEKTEIVQALKTQCGTIDSLSPETIAEMEGSIASKEQAISGKEKEEAAMNQAIHWYQRRGELAELLHSAGTAHEQALAALRVTAGRQVHLQRVEAIQPVRTWAEQLKTQTSLQQERAKTLEDLLTDLKAMEADRAILDQKITTDASSFQAATAAAEQAGPLLKEAKELDIYLHEKDEQYQEHLRAMEGQLHKKQEQEVQLVQTDNSTKGLQEQLAKIAVWLEEHKDRQPIAENERLLYSKLQDATQYLSELEADRQALKSIREDSTASLASQAATRQRIQPLENAITTAGQALSEMAATLGAVNIEMLEHRHDLAIHSAHQLLTSAAQWKGLMGMLDTWEENSVKITSQQQTADAYEKELETLTPAVGQAKLVLETTRQLADNARLSAAENVSGLRSQLQDNMPCPVCGSTMHPYRGQGEQVNKILAELSASLDEAEADYSQKALRKQELETGLAHFEKQLKALQQEIREKESALQEAKRVWEQAPFFQQCKELSPAATLAWLEDQYQQETNTADQLKKEIRQYYSDKDKQEALQKELNRLKDQLSQQRDSIHALDIELSSAGQATAQLETRIRATELKLDDLEKELSVYFMSREWFNNWKKDPARFMASMEDFCKSWRTQLSQREEAASALVLLQEHYKNQQAATKELSATISEQRLQLDKKLEELTRLKDNRKRLFDGAPVEAIETALHKTVEKARDQWEMDKQQLVDHNQLYMRLSTRQQELGKEIALIEQQCDSYESKIDQWLKTHPQPGEGGTEILSRETLLKLLNESPEWIQSERTALNQLRTDVEKLTTAWEARKADLDHHLRADPGIPAPGELSSALQAIKTALDDLRRERTELQTQLKFDQDNKKKIGDLLRKLEKEQLVWEDWSRLHSVIGSADGKKFRQVAQEYTLDLLLRYANHHLKTFSNRYLLQRIPNSLGLQVLDQDMGDEVRTVYSLSGGESFLVSLALALGLASLSSHKMKVESLFIDEGFGSLDPATLNIAMDALERLHDQGRKVGVISHVQEMTERIPVQIRVHKQANGRSVIEVDSL